MDRRKLIGTLVGLGGTGALLYYILRGVWAKGITPSPSPKPQPAPTPTPIKQCNSGDQKCVGKDLYMCSNGEWILQEQNSYQCGYTKPAPIKICTSGQTKCDGYNLYVCEDNKWVLQEQNSKQCGYTQPTPTPTPTPQPTPTPTPTPGVCRSGDYQCQGYSLYKCVNGQWVLQEKYSTQCGYTPPQPSPKCNDGEYICMGIDKYKCINGDWVIYEQNAKECGAGNPSPQCSSGQTKCQGYDLYECQDGTWVLKEHNSPQCGYTTPATIKVFVGPFFGSQPQPYPLPKDFYANVYQAIPLSQYNYQQQGHKCITVSGKTYQLPNVTVQIGDKIGVGRYGTYVFTNVSPGSYTITIKHDGAIITKSITVKYGDNKLVNVSIPVVIVSANQLSRMCGGFT